MAKRPPEITWQDKAILVTIPIVVFGIFIIGNFLSKDLTVSDAFSQNLPKGFVRDGGVITQLFPPTTDTATPTQECRVRSRDGSVEFTFRYTIQGSSTMDLKIGHPIQFYGEYTFDAKGGVVAVPYKGKSGRMAGWAVYDNKRFLHKDEENGDL